MKNRLNKGKVIVPMVSPFNPDYSIDEGAVARMSELFMEAGVSVFVLGTTGEGDSMSSEQRESLLKLVAKELKGRLKLYAGLPGNSLHASIEDARKYAGLGANYLVAKLPSYYPVNDNQMFRYFELLADSSPLPLFLYNIPATTHHSIPLSVIEQLSHHPNIAGIKDSERDSGRLDESIRLWGMRDDFDFLIGWAAKSFYGLTKGANGIVPGTGNLVPGWYTQIIEEVVNGNNIQARQFQEKTDQVSAFYQNGLNLSQAITALKVMMNMKGLCAAEVLPPLQRMSLEEEKAFVFKTNEEWEKITL